MGRTRLFNLHKFYRSKGTMLSAQVQVWVLKKKITPDISAYSGI
jgi:hypothetical protein